MTHRTGLRDVFAVEDDTLDIAFNDAVGAPVPGKAVALAEEGQAAAG